MNELRVHTFKSSRWDYRSAWMEEIGMMSYLISNSNDLLEIHLHIGITVRIPLVVAIVPEVQL